jgi:hypothetical protein
MPPRWGRPHHQGRKLLALEAVKRALPTGGDAPKAVSMAAALASLMRAWTAIPTTSAQATFAHNLGVPPLAYKTAPVAPLDPTRPRRHLPHTDSRLCLRRSSSCVGAATIRANGRQERRFLPSRCFATLRLTPTGAAPRQAAHCMPRAREMKSWTAQRARRSSAFLRALAR